MGYSDAAKNLMLEELRSLTVYASLHSADPGVTGANELTGGSPAYARQSMTFAAASDGEMVSSNQPVFDVPAGFVLYVGFWTAVSSGTFLGSGALSPAPDEYTAQGLFKLTTGTFDLNSSGILVPALVGTAAIDAITADVAGYMEPYGAGASALTAITATVEGMMVPVGAVASTLSAITASGTATMGVDIEGTVAADLGAMTADSSGLMVPLAAGAADLSAMTASVSGVRVDTGTAAADISAMTASGTGEQTSSSTSVSDDFNRANETPMAGNWSQVYASAGNVNLASNQATGGTYALNVGAVWTADSFADDQYSEAKFPFEPAWDSAGMGVRVRQSVSADTYYSLEHYVADDGEGSPLYYVRVYKCVAGTRTMLGAAYYLGAWNPFLRLEVSGTTLTPKYKATAGAGWTTLATRTDSSIASGSAGFCVSWTTSADDWAGGDL